MKKLLILSFLLLIPSVLSSQTTGPLLTWDEPCSVTTGCAVLADVQAYTYNAYIGTATIATVLTPVTCTGTTSPFQCSTPNYAPFIGTTITLTAKNGIGESVKSAPAPLLLPATPLNVRLK